MTTEKLLAKADAAIVERDVETLRQCARRLHMARHPEAYYYEAAAYEIEEDLEKAIETLRRGIRAFPRDADRYVDLIELLEHHERDEDALQVCNEGIQALTGVPQFSLYVHKLRLLAQLQRYQEGIQAIEEAQQLPPPAYRPYAERVLEPIRMELYIKLNDLTAARQSLQRIETLLHELGEDPFLRSHLYSGQAELALVEGDKAQARSLAELALQYDRTNATAISIYYSTSEPVPEPVKLHGIVVASSVYDENEQERVRVTTYMIAARNKDEAAKIALDYEYDAIPDTARILETKVAENEVKQNVPIGIVHLQEEYYSPEELHL